MTVEMRVVYAQSSDIRSRSWLEYRRDMKKKAIAELEVLPFLEEVLKERQGDDSLRVSKHGGDAELWFRSSGQGVTGTPDYLAQWGDGESQTNKFLYEFQLVEDSNSLPFFDFKESKVGKKPHGKPRVPYADREFFYVVKDKAQYAFITPQWIADNGKIGGVPAWGNRNAYRVPRDLFLPRLMDGGANLKQVVAIVDDKNFLLEFQAEFLEREKRELSRELQQVVDEERLLKIVPRTLAGFFRVCLLLDSIGKAPDAPGVWIVYLVSFFHDGMKAAVFARYLYALDFCYFKCRQVQRNEWTVLECAIEQSTAYVERNFASAKKTGFAEDPNEAPIDALQQILFSVNLLEDICQDAVVNMDIDLPRTMRIFEMVPDVACWANMVRNARQ